MPAPTPPELRQQAAAKAAEALKIFENVKTEARNPTDEEENRYTALETERVGLEREAEKAERWAVVEGRFKSGPVSNGMVTAKDDPNPLPHNDPKNTRNGHYNYSMLAVMRHIMDPRSYPLDGLQMEVHQEMAKERKAYKHRPASGVNIPLDLPINTEVSRRFAQRYGLKLPERPWVTGGEHRALDTTAGAGSIPTIVDTTIIELLRARMVTRMLGARMMTDMQGLFAIPRQATASTFYMVTQGGAITASNQTIDQVPFSPHTGGVYTTYTRQLLEQTNQNAEDFVREDQSAVIARGVETQMLYGQGSAGYPLGIGTNPEIGVIALGTNGAAPTWTSLVNLESAVASFNAEVGKMKASRWLMENVTFIDPEGIEIDRELLREDQSEESNA